MPKSRSDDSDAWFRIAKRLELARQTSQCRLRYHSMSAVRAVLFLETRKRLGEGRRRDDRRGKSLQWQAAASISSREMFDTHTRPTSETSAVFFVNESDVGFGAKRTRAQAAKHPWKRVVQGLNGGLPLHWHYETPRSNAHSPCKNNLSCSLSLLIWHNAAVSIDIRKKVRVTSWEAPDYLIDVVHVIVARALLFFDNPSGIINSL